MKMQLPLLFDDFSILMFHAVTLLCGRGVFPMIMQKSLLLSFIFAAILGFFLPTK